MVGVQPTPHRRQRHRAAPERRVQPGGLHPHQRVPLGERSQRGVDLGGQRRVQFRRNHQFRAGQRHPAVRGEAVVRHAPVPGSWVGGGDPQRADRASAEGGDGVHRLADGHSGEAPAGAGAEVARALRHHRDVGVEHVPGGEQPAVQRRRLQVTAERLPDAYRADQDVPQPGQGAGEPGGQRPTVGEQVRHPCPGRVGADPGEDRRQRGVQVGGHHRQAGEVVGGGQHLPVR
ncbi:hypothetical protein GCM10029963_06690 [Micromonospora andamanensis]